VVELPEERGERAHLVVDCYRAQKTNDYLQNLESSRLRLVVATHPHYDHIAGLQKVLQNSQGRVDQFWDSGFRHNSKAWIDLVNYVSANPDILFLRPSSGLALRMAGVEITVLAPSVYLKNRYETYGVNINNASIVLKLAYGSPSQNSIILTADAQWDSWSKMTEEFPHLEKTSNPFQRIQVQKGFLPLKCEAMKVAHHGSKHGTALEGIERLRPRVAVISCGNPSRHSFPSPLATGALQVLNTRILHTSKGSVVLSLEDDGKFDYFQHPDTEIQTPKAPPRV